VIEKPKEDKLKLKKGIILGIVFTVFFTLPVFFNLFSSIPGKYSDTYQVAARTLMIKNKIEETGWAETLKWQSENDFWGILSVIGYVQSVIGENFGYNLLWMSSFFLAFLGAWLFTRDITRSSWAAGVAGFIFAFSPFHISQAISTNIGTMHYEWLVWLAFFLNRFFKQTSWKNTLGVMLTALAIIITEHQLLAFTLVFLVFYIPFLFYLYPKIFLNWKFWGITISGLLLLFAIGYTQFESLLKVSKSQDNYLKPPFSQVENYSADAIDFIIPARYHTFTGESFNELRDKTDSNKDGRQSFYLGYSVLFLSLLGLISVFFTRKKRRWFIFWFSISIIFTILSFGPTLHFQGKEYLEEKLPYILLYNHLPFWDNIRTVSRIFLVALLGWSFTAGYGAMALQRSFRKYFPKKGSYSRRLIAAILDYVEEKKVFGRKGRFYAIRLRKKLDKPSYIIKLDKQRKIDSNPKTRLLSKGIYYSVIFIVALFVIEYTHIPIAKLNIEYSPFYDELYEDKGNFSILEVPGSTNYDFGSYSMYTQSIHRKNKIDGMNYARVEDDRWNFQRSTPVFKELLYSLPTGGEANGPGDIINTNYAHLAPSIFNFYRVKYIVLSKKFVKEGKEYGPEAYSKTNQYIKDFLKLNEKYEDEFIKVFEVPLDGEAQGHILSVNTDGDYWAKKSGSKGSRARWAKSGASLNLVNLSKANSNIQISFEGRIKYLRQLTILLDGIEQEIVSIKDFEGDYSFQLQNVTPGEHKLEFVIKDEKGEITEDYKLKRGIRFSHIESVEL